MFVLIFCSRDGISKGQVFLWTVEQKVFYLTEPRAWKGGAGNHRWRNFLDDLKEQTQDWTQQHESR